MIKKAPINETGISINGRRAIKPVAKEKVYDEDYQYQSNGEGFRYLHNGFFYKTCIIQSNVYCVIFWQVPF